MLKQILFCTVLISLAGLSGAAELKFGDIFASGMILQREKEVPVWGSGTPGMEVRVTFKNQTVSGKVNPDGRWMVRLNPLKADGKGADLSVHSQNEVKTLRDVIVGEIWLCFGQSHMQISCSGKIRELNSFDKKVITSETQKKLLTELEAIPASTTADPLLRFCVSWSEGKPWWTFLNPKTVLRWNVFGLNLGLKLRRQLQIPVGIINIARGCSSLESWLPPESFTIPSLMEAKKQIEPFRKFGRGYRSKKLSQEEISKVFTAHCMNPKNGQRSYLKNGKADPKSYKWLWQHMCAVTPAANYDTVLTPFIPFAVRGVIWWQGDTNYKDQPLVYDQKLSVLVNMCRQHWNEPELPFINILQGQRQQYLQYFDTFRMQQLQTANQMSHFWIVNNVEIPQEEVRMIHPVHDKIRAGKDTADLLYNVFYGGKKLPCGPVLESAEYRDGQAILSFRFGQGLTTRSGKAPAGFELAGVDKKFYPAQAKIVNGKVIASSPQIAKPCYVRFQWSSLVLPDLVNANDLAAFPFNTLFPAFQKKNFINIHKK